ncbi:MAG: hypothetical protein KF911_05560 [Pseudomonadales bacterium]|nr:hypothetical protein [Pseudomonadales bacterium]
MRILVQFIVPALIFVSVVYLLERRRRQAARHGAEAPAAGSDTGPFLVILALGAAVAIVTALALQSFWA